MWCVSSDERRNKFSIEITHDHDPFRAQTSQFQRFFCTSFPRLHWYITKASTFVLCPLKRCSETDCRVWIFLHIGASFQVSSFWKHRATDFDAHYIPLHPIAIETVLKRPCLLNCCSFCKTITDLTTVWDFLHIGTPFKIYSSVLLLEAFCNWFRCPQILSSKDLVCWIADFFVKWCLIWLLFKISCRLELLFRSFKCLATSNFLQLISMSIDSVLKRPCLLFCFCITVPDFTTVWDFLYIGASVQAFSNVLYTTSRYTCWHSSI